MTRRFATVSSVGGSSENNVDHISTMIVVITGLSGQRAVTAVHDVERPFSDRVERRPRNACIRVALHERSGAGAMSRTTSPVGMR
jgi:hypothetical protein